MLYGYVKIGQVPLSDTGTSKTQLENVPIAYQRELKKIYSVFILNTGEGKKFIPCSFSHFLEKMRQKINHERESGIERGKAIENHRLWW